MVEKDRHVRLYKRHDLSEEVAEPVERVQLDLGVTVRDQLANYICQFIGQARLVSLEPCHILFDQAEDKVSGLMSTAPIRALTHLYSLSYLFGESLVDSAHSVIVGMF